MVDENAALNLTITPTIPQLDSTSSDIAISSQSQSLEYPLNRTQANSLETNDIVMHYPVIKLLNLLTAHQKGEANAELEKRKTVADSLTATITIKNFVLDEDGRVQYNVSYEQDRTQNMDLDENPFAYFYGQTIFTADDFLNEVR